MGSAWRMLLRGMVWLACVSRALAEIMVGNAGVPGNSSGQALARVEADVLSVSPAVAIVLVGTNDALNPGKFTAVPEYEANLLEMGRRLQAGGVKRLVLVTPPPAVETILRRRSPKLAALVPPPATLDVHLRGYGEAVRRVASKLSAVCLDSFEFVATQGGAVEARESIYRTRANCGVDDGVHFTAAGHEAFAAWLAKAVRPLVRDGERIVCLGDSITYGSHVHGEGTVEGGPYPAALWRLLNPELAASGRRPARLGGGAPADGNLLPNGGFERLDRDSFPLHWKFYRKDQDLAESGEGEAAEGKRYLRLRRSSPTTALCRSDLVQVRPGRHRVAVQVRGRGQLTLGVSLYHPVRHLELRKVLLTEKWRLVEAEFEVPRAVSQASLVVRCAVEADVDAARLVPCGEKAPRPQEGAVAAVAAHRMRGRTLEVGFASVAQGAAIVNVTNPDGVEFVHFPVGRGLWSIRLKSRRVPAGLPPVTAIACDPEMDDSAERIGRDGAATEDLVIDAYKAAAHGARCQVMEEGGALRFRWSGIRVGGEADALAVDIRVSPSPHGGVQFEGGFVNRSREYTAFYFSLPQVEGLGRIHGAGVPDWLATPHYLGRLICNPASGRLLQGSRLFRSNNSGHSMHFDALYSGGDGVLFGVWDPAQNCKRWDLESSASRGFSWRCLHLPDNMRCAPPQRWTVPYPVELRGFRGDWYDAAQLYREWALRQEWCSRGPLARRRGQDIPEWFLDTTLWLHVSVGNLLHGQRKDCERYFRDFAANKVAVWLTHWGLDNRHYDFPNPDRFPLTAADREALSQLARRGVPASGYIQLTGWTCTLPSFRAHPAAKANLLRNYYGQILSWGGSGPRRETMLAWPGELWGRVLGDVVERMARAGFRVAYLDSGNHGGAHLNFTPACGAGGGGGHKYVDDTRRLMTALRERGRRIEPGFCVTSESFWEGNLHCLDAVLCVNSPSAYLEGERVTAIPLAPAVYHDYALLFATHYGRADLAGQAEGLVAKTGQALLWGIMPGWELPHAMYRFSAPDVALRSSRRRMAAYDAGRKFLQYGKMLRPPPVAGDNPRSRVEWGIGWRDASYGVLAHAVQGAAFAGADGSLGVALYNRTGVPRAVSVDLDDEEYGVRRQFRVLYPPDVKAETVHGRLLRLTVPPLSPVILEGK